MTIGSKLKQTLASLQGVDATLGQYATYHPQQVAKKEFALCQKQVKQIVNELETRIKQIEFEEPQYKVY